MKKGIFLLIFFAFIFLLIFPIVLAQVPPDKSLIKSSDSPKVYWFQNNVYYWILDEPTFNKMSPLWSFTTIIEYSAATFNSQILNNPAYKQGPNFLSDNLLIKKTSPTIESTVFLTQNNQRRAFFNYDALIDPSYNFQELNIIGVTQTLRDSIFSGDFIYAVGYESGRINLFRDAFNRAGGINNLGYARTTTQPWGAGQIQYFKRLNDNSAIVYNPNENYAYPTYGAIYTKYTARGANIYGFPTSDLSDGIISSITGARPVYQRFRGGSNTETSINHHFTGPRAGLTVETHSPILEKWAAMGYGASCAGLPTSDVYSWQNGIRADFENGYIYWDGATTIASCEPPVCTNDCNQGTTRCATSIVKQACGNYDADSCTEWGGDFSCANGCELGVCKPAVSCSDGIKNGDEADIDCGGSCSACPNGKSCSFTNTNCQSTYCNPNNICSVPSCTDGWRNGNEAGIDCGGSCSACPTAECENPSGGDELTANAPSGVGQHYPSIAIDPLGDFVITWHSNDGSGDGIFAQRFNADGSKAGNEFRVNTYTTNGQQYPDIAMDANGNFVITWESYGQDGSSLGIYAQRFNGAGIPQGPEFKANTYITDPQSRADVAMDAQGNFVITWVSLWQDGSGDGIFAQRFDSQGNPQGPEIPVNQYTADQQRNPAVAMDTNGNFVITWASIVGQSGWGSIYAQRYDKNGNALGNGNFEVNIDHGGAGSKATPSIAMDAQGNFVITWASIGQDGSDWGIFARRFDRFANPLTNEIPVNTYTFSNQEQPAIAMDAQGNFMISWRGYGGPIDGFDIFARRFDFNGNPLSGEFDVNIYAPKDEDAPAVAMTSKTNFIITWYGWRQDNQYDVIYRMYKCVPLCSNGAKDPTETDIDCGGSCTACPDDKSCSINPDCQSNYCNPNNYCSIPRCDDEVKNGNEEGKDCGGSCNACPESNDNPFGANIFHLNSFGSETLNSVGDAQDWWVIPGAEITADGSLAIVLSNFKSSNQDFDLYVFGDDASTQLCSSTLTDPLESCNVGVKSGKSYYINVLAYSGSGSYQIQNTFSTIPNPPGQVTNLRETSHTDTTICIDWSKPITGGNPTYYHIRENIKSTDATQSTTGFCRNDFPPATDVRFTIEACNADGCPASSELTRRTDSAIVTSSKPVITSFIINSTKINDKPIVSIKGTIENQAGVINNPDFNAKIDIFSDKMQLVNTTMVQLSTIDSTHANFVYTWVPNQSQYGQILTILVTARDGDKKSVIEDKIKLSVLKGKKILIDPGHGLINNSGTWGHTRPWCKRNDSTKTVDCSSFGSGKSPPAGYPDTVINEGLNTVKVAKELKILLENESAIVNVTRNLSLDAGLGRSGRPAWEEGAYEYINNILKENIAAYKNCTDVSEAECMDIDIRPKYSNRIKPDFTISIHTNAGRGSGSQFVWYDLNDLKIANSSMRPFVMKTLWGENVDGPHDKKLYYKNAAILRDTIAPTALVEVAYHDNYNDHVNLTQQAFLQRAAQGIFNGIQDYFIKKGNINLTILTLRVNAYSPFKVKVSVTGEDGELTSGLNGQKINETNFEVYLIPPGESPSPEKKQEFTAEELSTGIYELTINPNNQIIGEASDLYISIIDPTEPEGQQLSDLAVAPEAVYISDHEGKPVVNLISPFNNSIERGKINFTYKANDDGNIETCSLLINGAVRETKTNVIKNTEQTFEQILVDGAYFWNIECKDNTNLVGASSVYQLSVELDTDDDGILDKNDNCPSTANPDQKDADQNNIGDACNEFEDSDNDEYANILDNCPSTANPEQQDTDNNGIGDTCELKFLRGDANADGSVDISDPIKTLLYLYSGAQISCKETADANDDGKIDISDPQYLLNFIFKNGPSIKQPYPSLGIDTTPENPDLGCVLYNPPQSGGGGGSVQTVKEALNETKNNKTMDNQTKSIIISYLEAIPKGSLSITSSPSSAYVYLDGSYKGLTPRNITNLSSGNYTLKLVKSGYLDYKKIVNIQSGKTTKLSPTLLQQLSTTPSPSPSPY